jgi:hypothetical protein
MLNHTQHIDHIFTFVRSFGDATTNLMPQAGAGQGKYSRVNGCYLSDNFGLKDK